MKITKLLSVLIISTFLFQSCGESPKDESLIINQIVHKMKDHKSAHFKIDEMYYYSDGIDTTTTDYEVWLIRDKNDSLRHGFAWVDNNYRPYNMIFTHDSLYLTIPPKKISVVYDKINESCTNDNDWIGFFLNPELLKKQTSDSNNTVTFTNVEFEGKACTEIQIGFPKKTNGDSTTISYIIDKTTLLPLFAKMETIEEDQTYNNQLRFSNFDFDQEKITKLRAKHKEVLAVNPIVSNESKSDIALLEMMLHEGDNAPFFTGSFYKDGKEFKLEDYIGKKVILLDFWYTHCPPCVQAIPDISKFNAEMQDKGLVVFGLNSVDNQPRNMDNLKRFLSNRDISYDIIMTQPEVDKAYKIEGYPSMYVIGLDGKIAYVEVGYEAKSFAKLKDKVFNLLLTLD
jgi:peroxiredoxin